MVNPMRLLTRAPRAELGPYVECLWFFERDGEASTERVLPSGRIQLLVDLTGRAPLVTGPRAGPVDVPGAAMTRLAGAVFHPGGAAPFFDVPCATLRDLDVELELLWGPRAREVRDWLEGAAEPADVLARLERSLTDRLRVERAPGDDFAAARASLDAGARVHDVADDLGVSRATLARTFDRVLGLSPKQYAGLVRFQRAVLALAAGPTDLADLAVACGYHDQAHMTRDFQRFGGITPGRYRPLPSGTNHVAVPES